MREPSKLAHTQSKLEDVNSEADRLWADRRGGVGWEVAALQEASRDWPWLRQ